MQTTEGYLKETHVLVPHAHDIGRLYQKSRFGAMDSSHQLHLDLLEALFLLGEKKITIYRDKQKISFEELVFHASQYIPQFEMKYLIFRDLRSRGLIIKSDATKQYHFLQQHTKNILENKSCITIFSERDSFHIKNTCQQCLETEKKHVHLWYSLLDEEGDITYYDVTKVNPAGEIPKYTYEKTRGIVLTNRVVLFDQKSAEQLHKNEFYGKPFGSGLQLSLIEALYLHQHGILELQTDRQKKLSTKSILKQFIRLQPDITVRLPVFTDLKQRGLIVKTGFKFGTHFRAYTRQPDLTHAEYLIQAVPDDYTSIWSEISRAVRLAHSVHKDILFACVKKDAIEYIRFGRLRP